MSQIAARLARIRRQARRRLGRRLANRCSRVHRLAAFGEGSVIRPPLVVYGPERISVGAGVWIGPRAFLSLVADLNGRHHEPSLAIGDGCSFGDGLFVSAAGHIEIGRHVQGSRNVFIGDTYHEYADPSTPVVEQPLAAPRPVVIGDGSFLGVGCCILPGVTLGENAYVAAGAVVTKDVPPRTVVAGNPARIIRQFDGARWRSAAELGDHLGNAVEAADLGAP